MPAPKAIHCVYFKTATGGKYKWGARLSYQNASGTFPTVKAVKKWARDWARHIGAKLTFEKL